MRGKGQTQINPKPKREDFDSVLKALLDSPPVTREEVHKETSKRKKRASKVITDSLSSDR